MKTTDPSASLHHQEVSDILVEVDSLARWEVYLRLQELSIAGRCKWGKPLHVQVDSAIAALQLWSVVQSVTAPKSSQVDHLTRCWALRLARP